MTDDEKKFINEVLQATTTYEAQCYSAENVDTHDLAYSIMGAIYDASYFNKVEDSVYVKISNTFINTIKEYDADKLRIALEIFKKLLQNTTE